MGWQDRSKWKWASYSGLYLLLFLLESCLLSRFPLAGTIPRLTPLGVAAVGFWEGSCSGALFGLGAGALCALVPGGQGAALVWQYTAVGLFCGTTVDKTLGRSFFGYLLCALLTLLGLEGLQVGLRVLFLDQPLGAVARIAGWEGLYSLFFAPLIYPAVRLVREKFRQDREF